MMGQYVPGFDNVATLRLWGVRGVEGFYGSKAFNLLGNSEGMFVFGNTRFNKKGGLGDVLSTNRLYFLLEKYIAESNSMEVRRIIDGLGGKYII